MVRMFNLRTVWGKLDENDKFVPIPYTVFNVNGLERVARINEYIERMQKDNASGYMVFHRGREHCSLRHNILTIDEYSRPFRQWQGVDKVVAVLTPCGNIELHNKNTGSLLCNMTANPEPEWVEYQRR